MKTRNAILSMSLTVGAALAVAGAPLAKADDKAPMELLNRSTEVKQIRLTNLGGKGEQFVHVFYVSAREATASADDGGQVLKVRQIKQQPLRIEINSHGEAKIPAAKIPRSGFLSCNYVVFALTKSEPNPLFIKNSDGTCPTDPRMKVPCDSLRESDVEAKKRWITLNELNTAEKAEDTTTLKLDWRKLTGDR